MNLFEHLNAITLSKQKLDTKNLDEYKSYSPYMINRFISMSEMFIPLVNEMNCKSDVPKEVQQSFYRNMLPKRKQYFKYMKKKKEKNENDKKYVAEYYQIGIREANNYMEILSDSQIKEIKKKYVYGKNNTLSI